MAGCGTYQLVLTSQLTLIGLLAGSLGTTEELDTKGRAGMPDLLKLLSKQTQRPPPWVRNAISIGTRIGLVTLAFSPQLVAL